jgi:hypothetical protein
MGYYEPLVTPLLISGQDFAFRGRPVSLRLSLQSTARSIYIHDNHNNEKIRTSWILYQEPRLIVRIFLQLNYFCPSLLPFTKHPAAFGKHRITNRK